MAVSRPVAEDSAIGVVFATLLASYSQILLSRSRTVGLLLLASTEARGSLQEALGTLRGVPANEQATYVFELRRAWLRYLTGRHEAAITGYMKAINWEPGAVEPRLGIMLPLMAMRRWQDVQRAAQQVLRLEPKSYLGISRLAFALYNLGRYADAEKRYRQALAAYPSDVEMRSGLGWCLLQTGDRKGATIQFDKVLAIAPRHASAAAGARAAQRE